MNRVLKLQNCRCMMKKLGENGAKVCSSSSTNAASFSNLQNVQQVDSYLRLFPTHSLSQVREFAKKAQGKLMKGGKAKTMNLSDEEMADVIDIVYYKERLQMLVEKLKKDYVENLSIHGATGNIDKILVKIDDEEYPLNELAVISKKNPNLIAINMAGFPEALKPAIQAIVDSGSGFNPQQEGTMIYVSIPKLTREHRENLAKNAKSLFVKIKDEVRLTQNSFVKEAKEKTEVSEDLVFSATNQIMAMAERCTAELEKIMKTKQKELLGDS